MRWLIVTITIVFGLGLVALCAMAGLDTLAPHLGGITRHGGDKVGHFLLMGTMAFLVNRCLSVSTFRVAGIRLLKGSVIVAAVVTLEELSQAYIPARSCSWSDLLADYAGIVVLGRLALLLPPARSRPRPEAP